MILWYLIKSFKALSLFQSYNALRKSHTQIFGELKELPTIPPSGSGAISKFHDFIATTSHYIRLINHNYYTSWRHGIIAITDILRTCKREDLPLKSVSAHSRS